MSILQKPAVSPPHPATSPEKESSTRSDILQHLLRAGQATARQIADALDLTIQGIRRHLKVLESEGLIGCESVPMPIGRPQNRYRLSPAGRATFPDSYNQFALTLLRTIAETMPEQLGPILKTQWRKKLEEYQPHMAQGSLGDRLAMLVALRRGEGFMSECHPIELDETGARSFFVTDYHCAIADIAEAFPRVCGHEMELYVELFPDCTVERTHWMIRGESHCGYRIEPQ